MGVGNLGYNHFHQSIIVLGGINMVMPVMQYAPETCAWCEGAGKYGQYGDICLVCNGQGSVLVAQPSHQCPHCAGKGTQVSGEYHDRCKICGGSGWSHVYKTAASNR